MAENENYFKPVLGRPDDFYVKAVVYRGRVFALSILVIFLTIAITSILFGNIASAK